MAAVPAGPDAPQFVRRRRVHGGIHEHRQPPTLEIKRVLDLQLEVHHHLNAGEGLGFEALGQHRADRIVAPAGVADGEHDDRRDHARPLRSECSSAPSASRSSTASGILPSAWVAQDRQGSKARTATSMWLSKPSVSVRPSR